MHSISSHSSTTTTDLTSSKTSHFTRSKARNSVFSATSPVTTTRTIPTSTGKTSSSAQKSSTMGHSEGSSRSRAPPFTGSAIEKASKGPNSSCGHTTVDMCFVSNCFCCDCCVWSPINSRFNDPRPKGKRQVPRSKPLCVQLKQNLFFYITIIILCAMNGCVAYFDALFLANEIHITVLIISQVLFAMVLFTLLVTACTDPGILPPATDDEAAQLEKEQQIPPIVPGQKWVPPVRAQDIAIKGQAMKLKYCFTCRYFRPPRATHCSTCNVCVDNFDHHCPWIGNCVGRRNYRAFFLFINSLAALGVYDGALVLTHMILLCRDHTVGEAIKKSPASLIELILIVLAIWSVLGLAGFHCYLVMSNLTTNEDIKSTFVSKRPTNNNVIHIENPFTLGSAYGNCQQVLCSARASSRLRKA